MRPFKAAGAMVFKRGFGCPSTKVEMADLPQKKSRGGVGIRAQRRKWLIHCKKNSRGIGTKR